MHLEPLIHCLLQDDLDLLIAALQRQAQVPRLPLQRIGPFLRLGQSGAEARLC